ncbi:MAG: 50S ribosomal protein L18 [Candidatus Uhrbacteria bacterium]|nr:50S ribosomal protein L18 [Candidatus Uhrbacteria bacterium]
MEAKKLQKKRKTTTLRARRTRAKIRGTAERPRLSVSKSLKHISVQVIDDAAGKTLASASDIKLKVDGKKPVEVAALVGAEVAKAAVSAGIESVVFDRGPYKYHGSVKALADAAREGGLKF